MRNQAPTAVHLSVASPADDRPVLADREELVLDAVIDDAGAADWHTLRVDWGDGSPVVFVSRAPGAGTSLHHQYDEVDVPPGGDPVDTEYTVTVRAADEGELVRLTGTVARPGSAGWDAAWMNWGVVTSDASRISRSKVRRRCWNSPSAASSVATWVAPARPSANRSPTWRAYTHAPPPG